jgi:hypothetical protein
MGNAGYATRELRFIIAEELTHAYVLLEAQGDCPIGVQGWHYKVFPASMSVADILRAMSRGNSNNEPVLWPQEAPP